MSGQKESWHLDKKVPVSIILVLLGQMLIGAWVAGDMSSRLVALESQDEENREVNKIVYGMEADIQNIKDSLLRIERAVTNP